MICALLDRKLFALCIYPILHVEEGKGDQGEEDGGQELCLGVRLRQPGNLATWQPSGQDGRWTVVPHTSHPCPECLPRTCRLDLCWEDSLSLDLTDFMAILIDSVSVMQSLEYGGQHCAL